MRRLLLGATTQQRLMCCGRISQHGAPLRRLRFYAQWPRNDGPVFRTMNRRLELVWTGTERDETATRDTAVAARDLFLAAHRIVLVAGYALYDARAIFELLAQRMVAAPTLRIAARSDRSSALEEQWL